MWMNRNVTVGRFLRITYSWIRMEVWVRIFFVSSLFFILAKHSCQMPPESLSPIIILPPSSGISYESLHYPVPVEQQYQVIPLVINTGKIPLIKHAVQAPIQYFVPNSENRRPPIHNLAQYSTARDERLQLRNPDTLLYSNDAQTENRQTYDSNSYSPAATATVYSETRVGGLPESRRYSYGYKIIDGQVGDFNDRHDASMIIDGGGSASYSLTGPDETDKVFEHTIDPGAKLQEAANRRNPDESDLQDNEPDYISRALKPIVVKTELNTTKTELKKYYKNVTNPETPINVTNKKGILTTINPAQR